VALKAVIIILDSMTVKSIFLN